jgi:hypothetical protein
MTYGTYNAAIVISDSSAGITSTINVLLSIPAPNIIEFSGAWFIGLTTANTEGGDTTTTPLPYNHTVSVNRSDVYGGTRSASASQTVQANATSFGASAVGEASAMKTLSGSLAGFQSEMYADENFYLGFKVNQRSAYRITGSVTAIGTIHTSFVDAGYARDTYIMGETYLTFDTSPGVFGIPPLHKVTFQQDSSILLTGILQPEVYYGLDLTCRSWAFTTGADAPSCRSSCNVLFELVPESSP